MRVVEARQRYKATIAMKADIFIRSSLLWLRSIQVDASGYLDKEQGTTKAE